MSKALVLDSNVLVLLVVGLTSEDFIARHRRLYPTYRLEHFKFLQKITISERMIATSPHALTEASNLARQCGEPMRTKITNTLGRVVSEVEELEVKSADAVAAPEFLRLGLTDAAFLSLDPDEFRILSADIDLILALQGRGFEVINFQHLIFGK